MKKTICYTALLAIISVFIISSCGVKHKQRSYIKKTYKDVKNTFPEAQVQLLKDSIKVIFPNNVVFDVGSSQVKQTFNAN